MAFYLCLVTILSWHIENNEKRLTPKILSVLEILDSFKVMIWNAHLIFAKIPPLWGKNPPQMSSFILVCFWCKGLRFHMESTSYPGWFNLKYLSPFLWFNFPCRYKCIIYLYHWIWIASIMNPIWSIQTMNPIHSSIKCYRDFEGT